MVRIFLVWAFEESMYGLLARWEIWRSLRLTFSLSTSLRASLEFIPHSTTTDLRRDRQLLYCWLSARVDSLVWARNTLLEGFISQLNPPSSSYTSLNFTRLFITSWVYNTTPARCFWRKSSAITHFGVTETRESLFVLCVKKCSSRCNSAYEISSIADQNCSYYTINVPLDS